jgi:F-box interacting protein
MAGGEHEGGVSLPEDIIFDVLARLPAKSLCRFRCMCKGWRDLISDLAFVAAQRSHAGPYLVSVFFRSCLPPQVLVTDMDGNVVRVFRVLQQATTRLDLIVQTSDNAMIIDPAAGRACTVATNSPMAMSSFGRASPSGALKVLFVDETLPSQICKVATIVGTEPSRWRQRSAPPFVTSHHPETKATVNGVIYFLPRLDEYDVASGSGRINIAAFDLESEEWKMINGQAFGIQEKIWHVKLIELKGCLGVVQFLGNSPFFCEPHDHCYAIIWLLVDSNKSVWVKEYTIEMPKTWRWPRQLWALDDGRILFLVSKLEKATKLNKTSYHRPRHVLEFYNPSTKAFTKLMDVTMGFYDKLVLYNGSLLS